MKNNPVDQQAAEWFIRLQDAEHERGMGNYSRSDLEFEIALKEWLDQSIEHETAFVRAQQLWNLADALGTDTSEASEPAPHKASILSLLPSPRNNKNRRYITSAIAASFLIFFSFALLFDGTYFNSERQPYQTSIGKQLSIEMEDGSIVVLNTDTEIQSSFSAIERRIHMTRGEAFFQVEKDAFRPFVVSTSGGDIQALGTDFNVRIKGDSVIVSLMEGQVQISKKETSHKPEHPFFNHAILIPGQQAILGESQQQIQVGNANIASLTDWRLGKLRFSGTRLGDAVDEINRYTSEKIVIDDPALSAEPVSAYFHFNQLDSFFSTLEEHLDVSIEKQEGFLVITSNKG